MMVSEVNRRESLANGELYGIPYRTLWMFALIIGCFYPVVARLVDAWTTDENMSHGIFVPFAAGYIAWLQREELARIPRKPMLAALVLLLFGGLLLCVGGPRLTTYVSVTRLGFLMVLLGSLLLLEGWRRVVALVYPLALVLFMIPPPEYVLGKITLPLQFIASWMSEQVLSGLGYAVLREGNVIQMSQHNMAVAEACSGLRSLFSLTFLTMVYAWLFEQTLWRRALLIIGIVPIAIAANCFRIVITGMLGQIDEKYVHGTYHDMAGYSIFLVAFGLLWVLHKVILRLSGGEVTAAREVAHAQ
jgi:exosortase